MAQDATGTPTSLGIPKYNTASDAPSGKGFNAAMDQIDALLVARGLPTGVTNGPVYWNGSAWVSALLTENQLDPNAGVPAGVVAFTAAATAPGGWIIADGAAISRTTYSRLFSAIGTQFGVGDGSTTFNIPNLKGRVPVGIDAGDSTWDVRGETGGAKTHTLSVGEMPAHGHAVKSFGTTSGWGNEIYTDWAGGGGNTIQTLIAGTGGVSLASNPYSAQSTGGGGSHNNIQPFIALHGIIKT